MTTFAIGDRVMHEFQGAGTIVGLPPDTSLVYEVALDSRLEGGGSNGSWLSYLRYITLIARPDPNAPKTIRRYGPYRPIKRNLP
jgi:hypothetical protein